ncbi:hypothetical protein [uncultured Rothia sp.]|uniref:hypothetical protein n=2 Tax=uncultured Rothia sp. TaxID=316088 RepID=UPI0028DC5A9D|nr:hypothetical protein [uncultured Rothia sp.]
MKKSIAVLSLSLASLLGLAACAPAVKAPVASRDSASASASASPSASPSAEDSQSASESPSASSESSSKPSSSASAQETASSDSTEEDGAAKSRKIAMDLYKAYARSVAAAERARTGIVKGENADGKTYTSERNKVTLVAGKDNEYVIRIKDDGSWSRARANGEAELVNPDGSWVRIKPDGERIEVKGSGTVYIYYHQGDVPKDLINTLETPKLPAPVEGGVGVPKEPVKPTKISSVTN